MYYNQGDHKERNKGDSDWLILLTFKIWMFRFCFDCEKELILYRKKHCNTTQKKIATMEIYVE